MGRARTGGGDGMSKDTKGGASAPPTAPTEDHMPEQVNGRDVATPELIQDWCRVAHAPLLTQDAGIDIAQTLNYAAMLWFCWHPSTAHIRRLNPTWAPRQKRGRGRPLRLENNLATNLRKKLVDHWRADGKRPRASAVDFVIEQAMEWLTAPKSTSSASRAARRRHAMRNRNNVQ